MKEDDWMKIEMEKRGQTEDAEQHTNSPEIVDTKSILNNVEPFTGPAIEAFKKQLQEKTKELIEKWDQAEMEKHGFDTKEQLQEYRAEQGRRFQEFLKQTAANYEASIAAAEPEPEVEAEEPTIESEPMDEEERITAIIYSDPELRELYATDRDEAITQARIRMFENAETESVPLTSKPEDGYGFPGR